MSKGTEVVALAPAPRVVRDVLTEIAREGARKMLAKALEDEVAAYIGAAVEERDEDGRRLVVRNGHADEREVQTGLGAVEVRAPRVWDGNPAQGPGGTAESVQRARNQRMPVLHVLAGNRRPGTNEPTSLGEDQGRLEVHDEDRLPKPVA